MSLSLSIGWYSTRHTCAVTVSTFMLPVSCTGIEIELSGFSGGEHQKFPWIRRTSQLENKGMQPGSLHLSGRVSKRTLDIPMPATRAVLT